MGSVDRIFSTRTALPRDSGFNEIAPAAGLSGYVRCFWTDDGNSVCRRFRIIPDCCADIIIPLDGESAIFVGMSDKYFVDTHARSLFGIRLFGWTASCFVRCDMSETFNTILPASDVIDNFEPFRQKTVSAPDTQTRVILAQKFLTETLAERTDSDVMNSILHATKNSFRLSVRSLSDYCALSERTLERKFIEQIGTSPKSMLSLLRYQALWQSALLPDFNFLDYVYKYGYYDQAHMLNSFKRYHGISLSDARRDYLNG